MMPDFSWKFEKLNKVVIRKLTKWRRLARRLASCRYARGNCSLSQITAISCILNRFIGVIIILTSCWVYLAFGLLASIVYFRCKSNDISLILQTTQFVGGRKCRHPTYLVLVSFYKAGIHRFNNRGKKRNNFLICSLISESHHRKSKNSPVGDCRLSLP